MSPEEWYKGLPPITKVYWTTAVAFTILSTIGALNASYIFLDFDLVYHKFNIWRLFTNFFFFGNFGMGFIFQVVLLVRYVGMLEEKFGRDVYGTAAMLTMLSFGIICTWLLAYFLLPPSYFYGPAIVFMCIYVWSRSDPFAEVVFYGFSFKQWHTPFLFLLMGMLLGGNLILDATGIAIGHLYYFLTDLVPKNWGRTVIWTPEFMVNFVKYIAARWQTGAPPPVNSAAPRPNWQQGAGHRLG
jgi:Derlin-2/3